MFRLITLTMATLLSFSALSSNPDFYFKRFKIVRENNKVLMIKDRSLSFKFSIKPYLKFIKYIHNRIIMRSKNFTCNICEYETNEESLFINHDHFEAVFND